MHWKTIEALAGQRLMLGFEGTCLNEELKDIIGRIKAGGIILFKQNIESPGQLEKLCSEIQIHSKSLNLPPLFIAVDQEGGTVARLKAPFTQFNGNSHIRTSQEAEHFAGIMANELKQVGINMNLAPVMDVVPENVDSIMKDRVFPGDHEIVSALGCHVIQTLQAKGVMAVAKHFPGIGRTVKDSHYFLPVLDVDLATLENSDIKPFQAAGNVDVSGIMLSHISYPRLDPDWQASLSPFIVGELLRRKLGYQGLILTDDLDMKAISHDIKTCVRQILKSGIDLTLICHKGPNIDVAFNEMNRLLESDESIHASGIESFNRIIEYKKRFLSEN